GVVDIDLRMPAELVGVDERLDCELAEGEEAERVRAARSEARDLRPHVGDHRVVPGRSGDQLARARAESRAKASQEIQSGGIRLVENRDLRLWRPVGEDV